MKRIINFFTSLKVAILLITVLTILSIVGTLIPQNQEAIVYISHYPNTGKFLLELGFDDIYRSKIFISILFLLALSTILCTFRRCIFTYNRLFDIKNKKYETIFANSELKLELNQEIPQSIISTFTTIKKDENEILFMKRSGIASLIGALILHIGLVLILSGGFYGLIFGVETFITGHEGKLVPIVSPEILKAASNADKLSKKARYLRLKEPNSPKLDEYRKLIQQQHDNYNFSLNKPDFYIEFKKLWVDYYDEKNKTGIKSWNSNINFIKDNKIEYNTVVKVNQPVSFNNYTFYQAGWNKIYNKIKVKVEISSKATHEDIQQWNIDINEFPEYLELELNKSTSVEWCNKAFELISFYPDLKIKNGMAVTETNELRNPAAQIIAHDIQSKINNQKQWRAWAFQNYIPEMTEKTSNMPFVFLFEQAIQQPESMLTVKYDPGENIMWFGCLMFALGIIMCLGCIYKEEWILQNKNNNKLLIAISGNRSNNIYKNHLDNLRTMLESKNGIKGEINSNYE